jgi:cell division GTPase FtsZ
MKITELLKPGENDINLTLNDLDRVFEYEGFAYFKTLQCKQLSECIDKIKDFKYKPKGIIVNFQTNEKVLFEAVEKFMNAISTLGDENTDVIFTTKTLKSKKNVIHLIFTGIENINVK